MSGRRTIFLAALVAVLQIGFLAWMILGRAAILQNGKEVLLRVHPVDPRDLLRGDYVRLGYEASEIPRAIVRNAPEPLNPGGGRTVFVRLARQSDGYWKPVAANFDSPLAAPVLPDQVDIRAIMNGFVDDGGANDKLFVDYGIERFYLPEGQGLAIENDMRVRPFSILVAVDSGGTPQIKALKDGGQSLFEEPLY